MSQNINDFTFEKVNFSDKKDAKAYYQFSISTHKIGEKYGQFAMFPSPFRDYFCIGHAMRCEHLKYRNVQFFKVLRGNELKGFLVIFEDENFDAPIFACLFKNEEEYADIVNASISFIKSLGFEKAYCQIIPNHPVREKVKLKRLVGVYGGDEAPIWETWEV